VNISEATETFKPVCVQRNLYSAFT